MPDMSTEWFTWLDSQPALQTLLASLALLLAAFIANWIVKKILIRGLYRIMRHSDGTPVQDFGVIARLANVVPAMVLTLGVPAIPGLPPAVVTVVQNVCSGFIILTIALAVGAGLNLASYLYERRQDATLHPIKGYVQVVKIVLYVIATILIIATLIDRSPLILLSGLGAMAAVLMLIFQDTILSLVASVQITSNDVVRLGDWVEMPQLNADGFVIDLALHTVKVQNWDKTITTIPTKKMITESFKNWRGMQESGGRRIKRSIYLDQQSVHFLNEEERDRLMRFRVLQDYLTQKQKEIDDWNGPLAAEGVDPVNARCITNLGTFRAYVDQYLRQHPGIHQEMLLIVRQLSPTADGLPMEIYCFTNSIAWVQYESTLGDIFDHLLAILPQFGLRVFQRPSGADMRSWREQALEPARIEHSAP